MKKFKLLEDENKRLNDAVLKVQQWIDTKLDTGKFLYQQMMNKYYEMMNKHKKLEEQLKRTSAEKSYLKFVAQFLADKVEGFTGYKCGCLNDSDKENCLCKKDKIDFSGSLEVSHGSVGTIFIPLENTLYNNLFVDCENKTFRKYHLFSI